MGHDFQHGRGLFLLARAFSLGMHAEGVLGGLPPTPFRGVLDAERVAIVIEAQGFHELLARSHVALRDDPQRRVMGHLDIFFIFRVLVVVAGTVDPDGPRGLGHPK